MEEKRTLLPDCRRSNDQGEFSALWSMLKMMVDLGDLDDWSKETVPF